MLEVDIRKKLSSFTLDISFASEGASSILGVSGSGKSVTLKCIAGIMKPDEGRIVYNGRILYDSGKGINIPPQERHVGYMFQNYALFPDMTVRGNILAGLRWQKDRKEKERILEETASMLRITHLLDQKPRAISGGEAQRTALARMLVNRPELLLFDEPFSALDVHLRAQLQFELLNLLERIGKEYFIVTHSKDEAYHLSDMTYIMDRGRIISEGAPADVFRSPGTVKAAQLVGFRNIFSREEIPFENSFDSAIAIPDDAISFSSAGYDADILRTIEEPDQRLIIISLNGKELWMKTPLDVPVPDNPCVAINLDAAVILKD